MTGASGVDSKKAVFLSYASQDSQAAQQLCNALRSVGIEVWFDQSELRGGDAWDASIRRQIKACALFIPIVSRQTHARDEGYFRLEWKLAVDRSHLMVADRPFLLPVVIDDLSDQDEKVPDRFRDVQWTRLPGGRNAEAFADRVRRLLSVDPAATSVGTDLKPTAATIGASSRALPPVTRRLVPWLAGALLLLAFAYFITDRFNTSKYVATEAPAKSPAAATRDNSIAVLPFADMSEKKDQEYFSDGLSEELIDQLAHSTNLRVIARTSSFQFKGKNEDMRTIGQRLGVANLLEGSVRTSGKTMRITAQLIRVSDGSQLWSDKYDRDMGDIFKVQDSIAAAVVSSLQATMRGQAHSADHKSGNTEAYAAYLRGIYFQYKYTEKDSQRSIEALQEAVRIDSGFALAWATLARTYENAAISGWIAPEKAHAEARGAVGHALDLDPTLAYAHAQLMAIESNSFDFTAARAERDRVRELDPNDMTLLNGDAIDAGNAGRFGEAINKYKQAIERDPLNLRWLWSVADLYVMTGQLADAERTAKDMLAIDPGVAGTHCILGYALLAKNKPGAALAAMNEETDKDTRDSCAINALWSLGRRTEADTLLARFKAEDSATDALSIGCAYAWRNDNDEALQWIDRAYRNKEPHITALGSFSCFRGLRSDPRFVAVMHKITI